MYTNPVQSGLTVCQDIFLSTSILSFYFFCCCRSQKWRMTWVQCRRTRGPMLSLNWPRKYVITDTLLALAFYKMGGINSIRVDQCPMSVWKHLTASLCCWLCVQMQGAGTKSWNRLSSLFNKDDEHQLLEETESPPVADQWVEIFLFCSHLFFFLLVERLTPAPAICAGETVSGRSVEQQGCFL